MSENKHLIKDYVKKFGPSIDIAINATAVEFHLPDHKFVPWQQEAYNAIMAGQPFVFKRAFASGKTYLVNAIKEDMKIISKAIEKIDK